MASKLLLVFLSADSAKTGTKNSHNVFQQNWKTKLEISFPSRQLLKITYIFFFGSFEKIKSNK